MTQAIYLASNSPRRKELLTQIGQTFSVISASIEEKKSNTETAIEYVQRLALQKAQAGYAKAQDKESSHQLQTPALGADTIVVCDGQVLEKPVNEQHFTEMMNLLSAKTHQVYTAVALVNAQHTEQVVVQTDVTFKPLSQQEISDYWQSQEPQDKAGGYGIQGIAGKFVTHISGSYSAVVGLPLYQTEQLIKAFFDAIHH